MISMTRLTGMMMSVCLVALIGVVQSQDVAHAGLLPKKWFGKKETTADSLASSQMTQQRTGLLGKLLGRSGNKTVGYRPAGKLIYDPYPIQPIGY